jgi:hypothetical protein
MTAERRACYKAYRIPATIWTNVLASLEEHGNVPQAWVQALSIKFPGSSLIELLRQPRLSPFCLQEIRTINTIQVCPAQAKEVFVTG